MMDIALAIIGGIGATFTARLLFPVKAKTVDALLDDVAILAHQSQAVDRPISLCLSHGRIIAVVVAVPGQREGACFHGDQDIIVDEAMQHMAGDPVPTKVCVGATE